MSIASWDNEYAKLARTASQLRTTGIPSSTTDVQQLQAGLRNLDAQLHNLPLQASEVQRRRRLIVHLQQTSSGNSSNNSNNNTPTEPSSSNSGPQSQMAMAMAQQDTLIDSLAAGVGRLKNQTTAISEEANLHVNLMNDMDEHLDAAHSGLADETARAARLRHDASLWKLQMVVAGLFVLLILEVFLGLSP